MKFDDLKLRTKTLIPLVGIAVVFASVIGVGTVKLNDLTRRYGQIASGVEPAMLETVRATRAASKVVREAYGLLSYDHDSAWARTVTADFQESKAQSDNAFDEASRLNPAGADKYRAFKARFDAIYEAAKAPIAIGRSLPALTIGSKLKPTQLDQMAIGFKEPEALDKDVTAFTKDVRAYNHTLEAVNAKAVVALKREASNAIWRLIGLCLVSIISGLAVAMWTANVKVAAPLVRLGERMKSLAHGDLSVEIDDQARADEVGAMAKAVQVFKDNALKARALEAGLVESEARYRLLVETSTDVIVRYDAAGVIEYVSPSVRQLGFEPEDVIGLNAAEFGHTEDPSLIVDYSEVENAGRAFRPRCEMRLKRADGAWVWLEGNQSQIHDGADEVIGVLIVLRDVTLRRQMEDELRRQRAEAEAASLAKADFLANMSHEIRTPLTSIIGFAGLLEKMGELPEEARTYADRIATGGQVLLSVVNDVLDYSKIEAGQIELDPQPFDPAVFVNETIELVRAQAENRGLELRAEMCGALPAAVRADSGRVRQILLNLLGNAIKFTSRGGVTVALSYLAANGGRLRIAVTDTGVGIPADRIERLFQRFSQVDGSIARQYGGSGLGLAICKKLAELMGGEIGVETEEGRGSTFWFTIAAPAAKLSKTAAVGECGNWALAPARILIVDDVSVNRQLVWAMLSPLGLQLTEATSGAEAVEAALSTAFDLILMDLQMPGMDGLAAMRAIRANSDLNRVTPIVALSANVLPAQVAACRKAGMDDHIAKPIRPEELIGKIARWTDPAAGRATAETPQA
jgi:PAS domain S-box-containing protein